MSKVSGSLVFNGKIIANFSNGTYCHAPIILTNQLIFVENLQNIITPEAFMFIQLGLKKINENDLLKKQKNSLYRFIKYTKDWNIIIENNLINILPPVFDRDNIIFHICMNR